MEKVIYVTCCMLHVACNLLSHGGGPHKCGTHPQVRGMLHVTITQDTTS
jgi:hypothetical protein